MSRIFGEMRQLAFVVRDVDAAMKYWSSVLGVGPFFVKRDIEFSEFRYVESLPARRRLRSRWPTPALCKSS